MKKKISMVLLLTMVMGACQGCGNEIPDLTGEQQEIITQYAAQLLLKYDTEYKTQLGDIDRILAEEEAERLEQEAIKEQNDKPPMEDTSLDIEERPGGSSSEEDIPKDDNFISKDDVEVVEPEVEYKEINELLGMPDVFVEPTEYLICDSYPEGSDTGVYFAMDAASGCKFVVVKYMVTNLAAEAREVDFASATARFRISINGGTELRTLSTILGEDIANYKSTLAVGESVELVSVTEVKEEALPDITSLDVIVKTKTESAKIRL